MNEYLSKENGGLALAFQLLAVDMRYLINKAQAMKSIFNPTDTAEVINRINRLTPATQPQWGK